MFASDRDLLAIEPNLFRDLGWIGQRLTRGVASIAGTTLTCATPEVVFDIAGIGPRHVATVGGVSYEVVARLAATQLTLSRLRPAADGPILPPTPTSAVEMTVMSFAPQLAIAHRRVLADLGIDPDAPGGTPTEPSITNTAALAAVEAMTALAAIFTAAGSGLAEDHPSNLRAAHYESRRRAAREACVVWLDLDGDGEADTMRRLHGGTFVRA